MFISEGSDLGPTVGGEAGPDLVSSLTVVAAGILEKMHGYQRLLFGNGCPLLARYVPTADDDIKLVGTIKHATFGYIDA